MKEKNKILEIHLKGGVVRISLLSEVAPQHVERIEKLTTNGSYDNVVFHRVIDRFMAQTGDVQFGNINEGYNESYVGTGGSKEPNIPAEFSKLPFDRGTVGMARAQDPNSANSQFFIMFEDGHFLNGDYTLFGQVIDGMEHVDKIKRGSESDGGKVEEPDFIHKAIITS